MIKYLIEAAGGYDWIATSLLLLFFVVFLGSTTWILTQKKSYLERMSRMPLDDSNSQNPEI